MHLRKNALKENSQAFHADDEAVGHGVFHRLRRFRGSPYLHKKTAPQGSSYLINQIILEPRQMLIRQNQSPPVKAAAIVDEAVVHRGEHTDIQFRKTHAPLIGFVKTGIVPSPARGKHFHTRKSCHTFSYSSLSAQSFIAFLIASRSSP